MTASPSLKLRRVWRDNGSPSLDPEDYEVIDERGKRLGRMYRTRAVGGGHAWVWKVYSSIATYDTPPAGQAPTREAAMAAFKAAWATCQPRGRG
jgi:hypothetical protein